LLKSGYTEIDNELFRDMFMINRGTQWYPLIVALMIVGYTAVVNGQGICAPGADFVAHGQASYDSGDYAAAVDAFTCGIQADHANYHAYLGRFQAALLAGRYNMAVNDANAVKDYAPDLFDETLADYTLTLSADGSDVHTFMLRALLYWTLAQDQQVLDDCESIIQLDPQNAFAYLFRGSSNQYLGDRLTPPADFTQAVLLDPDNADLYALIGSTYVQTGDTINAMMNLDRAIEIDPANVRSYYFRGLVYMGETNYTEAVAEFSRAIELDPQYIDPYYNRGWTHARQGNYPQAISDFDQVITINAQFRWGYLGRGVVHELAGDAQAAVRDYMEYVRLNQLESIAGQPLTSGVPVTLEMTDGRVYTLPISVQAGQTVDITASSPNDRADPLIVLVGTDGTTALVGNDDEAIGDFTAAIHHFSIPANGTYTLLVTHSDGGFQGTVDVNLTIQ
jgi:tetratricopeptide (TPR) repeat protein